MKNRIEAMLARLQEAGRVLSGKNEAMLRKMAEMLNAMLAQLDKGEKGDMQMKEAEAPLYIAEAKIGGTVEDMLDRLRTAVQAKYKAIRDAGGWAYVFATYPDSIVVKVETGGSIKYYQLSYTDDGKEVKLGEPVIVEYKQTFEKMAEAALGEAEALLESVGEAQIPEHLEEDVEILEAADEKGYRWDVRLIKEGRSKNKRDYPRTTLTEAAQLFEGAKAYDGHKMRRDSAVRELVGLYENVGVRTAKGVTGLYGTLVLLENDAGKQVRDTLIALKKVGKLGSIGVSIDALGKTRIVRTTEGYVALVEKIHKVNSVDIVANPAAGGQFERLIASEGGEGLNKLVQLLEMLNQGKTLMEIKEAHPDWFDGAGNLTIEGVRINEAHSVAGVSANELAELKEAVAKSECRSVLTEKLAEANLPQLVLDKLAKRFGGTVFETSALDEAIKEEAELWAALSKETSALKGYGPSDATITEEELDKKKLALDGLFEGADLKGADGKTQKRYRSLKEAFVDITGKHPYNVRGEDDFNRLILRESICFDAMDNSGRVSQAIRESLTTASWGEILGDSITRKMLKEYNLPALNDWRKVVSDIGNITDFRTNRRIRYGGYGVLPSVAQGGPYQPLTSPTDEEATYSIGKKGGTEDLTLETIANDDLQAVRRIPTKLGRAAAKTLYRAVFDIFKDNPNCSYDATALFHNDHANLGSTALSHAALTTVRQYFREATGYNDDEPLMLDIAYILVPAELEELAWQLSNSAVEIVTNKNATVPNINAGRWQPIVVGYWTDASDWVAAADPNDIPTIEVGFYQGREEPELFVQDNPTVGSVFTADKITYKIRHIHGICVLDHRGFYKNVVA